MQGSTDNIYVKPGAVQSLLAVAADPDNDKLSYRWEVLPEPKEFSEGGDREDRPQPVLNRVQAKGEGRAEMKAPEREGPYRIFVYVTDGKNNVATANVPFYVKP